jgi:hypothetical protein
VRETTTVKKGRNAISYCHSVMALLSETRPRLCASLFDGSKPYRAYSHKLPIIPVIACGSAFSSLTVIRGRRSHTVILKPAEPCST